MYFWTVMVPGNGRAENVSHFVASTAPHRAVCRIGSNPLSATSVFITTTYRFRGVSVYRNNRLIILVIRDDSFFTLK